MAGFIDMKVIPIDLEAVQAKLSCHFFLPLLREPCRGYKQYPSGLTALSQRRKQQAHLNGFSQPNIVGNKPVVLTGRQDVMYEMYLMWQGVDIEGRERSGILIPKSNGPGKQT